VREDNFCTTKRDWEGEEQTQSDIQHGCSGKERESDYEIDMIQWYRSQRRSSLGPKWWMHCL